MALTVRPVRHIRILDVGECANCLRIRHTHSYMLTRRKRLPIKRVLVTAHR